MTDNSIQFDDDDDDDVKPPGGQALRRLVDKFKTWPTGAKIAAGVGALFGVPIFMLFALLIFAALLSSCLGGGDTRADASPRTTVSSTTTTTTTDPQQWIAELPSVAPLVAASLPAEEYLNFRNKVARLTADGETTLCDIFYGTAMAKDPDTDELTMRWFLTTPQLQEQDPEGKALPNSEYPVHAFYGPPCDVPTTDSTLHAPTTTTRS